MQVLQGLASRYEAHHRVCYTPAALRAAVELSARYVQGRCLPDKAIDVLDEAGSGARITAYYSRRAVADDPALKLEELQQVRLAALFVVCSAALPRAAADTQMRSSSSGKWAHCKPRSVPAQRRARAAC